MGIHETNVYQLKVRVRIICHVIASYLILYSWKNSYQLVSTDVQCRIQAKLLLTRDLKGL